MYSSCSLWFYGQIELIMENDKYNSIYDIYSNVNKNNFTYYIDIINIISNKFQHTSVLNINEIKDPKKIFFYYFINILSIDKKLIYNYLIDIDLFLKKIFPSNYTLYSGLDFIIKCQQIIKQYREFRCLLYLNVNYMKLTIKDDINFDIKDIEDILSKFEKEFNYKYSVVFEDISVQFINSLLNHGDEDIKNKIKRIYVNKEIKTEKISIFLLMSLKLK